MAKILTIIAVFFTTAVSAWYINNDDVAGTTNLASITAVESATNFPTSGITSLPAEMDEPVASKQEVYSANAAVTHKRGKLDSARYEEEENEQIVVNAGNNYQKNTNDKSENVGMDLVSYLFQANKAKNQKNNTVGRIISPVSQSVNSQNTTTENFIDSDSQNNNILNPDPEYGTENSQNDETVEENPWATSNCPLELPQGSTESDAQQMQQAYGCRYLHNCQMLNDGNGGYRCWWSFYSTKY